MKIVLCSLFMLALSVFNAAAADSMKAKQLGDEWRGLTKQSDPFDESKIEVVQIYKDDFTFRCGELNMVVRSYGFDGFSLDADLKYMIDDQVPVEKRGRFSTYLGGSKMITDNRYYSFKLEDKDVDAIKAGATMKVAGRFSTAGWETKSVSLVGFASAYNQMCR